MASLWILLASFMFALMGAGVKLAAEIYSLAEIVLYRGLFGVVIIYLITRHNGGSLRTSEPGAHLWRSGVGLISMWLFFFALAKLPLATAVTLNYMSPIWTAVWLAGAAMLGARHKVDWPMLLAIGISFAGVVLALRPAFEAQLWAGGLMGLGAGIMAAIAYMLMRRLSRKGEPEYRVVFYFSAINVGAGLLATPLPFGSPDGASWHAHSWYGAAILTTIGLTGTLAQVALTRAYRTGKTLVVANLQYTGIVFSSVLGYLLWKDMFDWHVWLGMAMILVSSIAATWFNSRTTN
jgi:S-adenosylmethionine uptake transporter